MKRFVLLASLILTACSFAVAQETETNAPIRIPATDAKLHLNADAVITGKVAEVYKTERVVRLNFEKPFPSHTFTAVIFANKTNLFPDLDALKDKTVEITGKIADYRGRPEIILTRTNQLKVIDSPAPGSAKTDSKP